MIDVRDLVAGYTADIDILHGVSLSVGPVDIVTILGPNGCGKSTLLKAIAGFVLPRAGTVTMHGRDIARVPVHRKIREHDIGFVPQTDNVFGALTVRENLMLGGHAMSAFPAKRGSRSCASNTRCCGAATGRPRARCPAASGRSCRSRAR